MPKQTPNLGLHQYDPATDGNDTFDIVEAINNPLGIIDEQLGAQIVPAAPVPVTINQGMNVLDVPRKSPFKMRPMQGKTTKNILGRRGLGNSLAGWRRGSTGGPATDISSVDSARQYASNSTIKVTANDFIFLDNAQFTMTAGKNYIAVAAVYNVDADFARISHHNGTNNFVGTAVNVQGVWTPAVIRIAASRVGASTNNFNFEVSAATAKTGHVAQCRVVEVANQAEFDATATMTTEEIAAKYLYADSIQSIDRLHITRYGENLAGPFTDWKAGQYSTTTDVVVSPYVLEKTVTSAGQPTEFFVPIIVAGREYTLSYTSSDPTNAYMNVEWLDSNGASLGYSPQNTGNQTITAPINATKARLLATTVIAGTFRFSNHMFNMGASALPFEPREDNALYMWDMKAASNVDGSIADTVYWDEETNKPRIARLLKTMDLDGGLDWRYAGDSAGYKTVMTAPPPGTNSLWALTASMVKYDGKIFPPAVAPFTGADQLYRDDHSSTWAGNEIAITIADADSGWGEGYLPTDAEVKAHAYGWKMSASNTDHTVKYDGTGQKYWYERQADGGYVAGIWTSTLPTSPSPKAVPYRLQYQLAQSIDEPISHEGAVTFHEGLNQVEMGTGIVVRERATLTYNSSLGMWYINAYDASNAAYKLKYRTNNIKQVFRNGVKDAKWTLVTDASVPAAVAQRGAQYAQIPQSEFDQSAVYEVNYLPIDTYALGIAPQSISGEYTPNLRETVDENARQLAIATRRITVLERGSAQKAQPRKIAPSLINGWNFYGGGYEDVNFYKDSFGVVHITGLVKGGTSPTAFILPRGFRPGARLWMPSTGYNGTGYIPAALDVDVNGNVVIANFTSVAGSYFSIDVEFIAAN